MKKLFKNLGLPAIITIVPFFTACILFGEYWDISLSLNKTVLTVRVGEEETLAVEVSPKNVPKHTVSWSSSDTSKVTVDDNGRIKGIEPTVNPVTITVFVSGDGFSSSAYCYVTVPIPVTGINLKNTSFIIGEGQEETLEAEILPQNAANKKIIWSSSDTSKVIVDDNGKIKGITFSSEPVTITATTEDGGFTGNCTVTVGRVTVNPPPLFEGITEEPVEGTVLYGSGAEFSAVVENPDGNPVQTVVWTIDNTVDPETTITNGVLSVAPADHGKTLKIVAASTETNIKGFIDITVVYYQPSDFYGTWVSEKSDHTGTAIILADTLEIKNDKVDQENPKVPYHYINNIRAWTPVRLNNDGNFSCGYYIQSTIIKVLQGAEEIGEEYNVLFFLSPDKNSFTWWPDDTDVFIKKD